ncbi:DUF4886 domain-containing protein [uncultured Proteiniphilum sp.]|mgnify:CR=1 FL=1|uniref:DUF4886 domain-containing protein n=1 Tax=uncultured Proteiniphilum sp. TaxID=497637 RepID=UPI002613E33B|nr:DUF4886 domain-containing protein [uncultured Proteiniphilum sp.]
MKKCLLTLWVFIVLFTIHAWSQDTIKVLAVGNSFSIDAVENYLYELGQADGVTFIIGNLHISSCSLEKHWSNVESGKAEYSYRKIDGTGKKATAPGVSLLQGINDENWDYISFQQNSANSGLTGTYFPYLIQLTAFVREHVTNPQAKFLFHQTWAYAQNSKSDAFPKYKSDQKYMYESIVKASRKAARKAGIKMIVPSGTAIQNGRGSFIGDRFCRDGHHLTLDLGRYTAACTWFETLSGKSVIGNSFAPATITPLEAITVQRAAHQAVSEPFKVTTVRLGVNNR